MTRKPSLAEINATRTFLELRKEAIESGDQLIVELMEGCLDILADPDPEASMYEGAHCEGHGCFKLVLQGRLTEIEIRKAMNEKKDDMPIM